MTPRRRPGGAAAVAGLALSLVATLATAVHPGGAASASAPAQAASGARSGIWISRAELRRLPERGAAWRALKAEADDKMGHADLSDKDQVHGVHVLAAALVYGRTGEERYRRKAAAGVMDAIGTEKGGRTLSLGRALAAYVISADLIDLASYHPDQARVFRSWLRSVRFERLRPKGRPTLAATQEVAPNNWGTMSGASRIAADIYLRDRADLARAAGVFKGYLGDRSAYHRFVFGGDDSWQADPSAPVGVLPAGATKDGHDIGGALPDDMRRGCALRFPPCRTNYPWEALQGAVTQAELLSRQGYDAWNWQDQALRRAGQFLSSLARAYPDDDWAPSGNDTWVAWLLNRRYGLHLRAPAPTRPGRSIGFTDWTLGPGSRCPAAGCASARGAQHAVTPVKGGPLGVSGGGGGDIERTAAVGGLALSLFALAGVLLARVLR